MNEQNNASRFDHGRVARFVTLAVAMACALAVVLRKDPSEHVFVLMNGIDTDLVEKFTPDQRSETVFKDIFKERRFLNYRAPEPVRAPVLSEDLEIPILNKHTIQGDNIS
jgi:hypothetical protein